MHTPTYRFLRHAVAGGVLLMSSMLVTGSPAHAWFASEPSPEAEITPLQYASLLALRDVNPTLFKTKLLPLIDTSMKNDGKITNAELQTIEQTAGSIAQAFYAAAQEPSWRESLDTTLEKAKQQSKDLGKQLEDTLSQHVGPLVDDAFKMLREKMGEAPAAQPSAPGRPESSTDI